MGEPDMSGDYEKDAKDKPDPSEDKAAQDAAKDAVKQEKQDQIRDNANKGDKP